MQKKKIIVIETNYTYLDTYMHSSPFIQYPYISPKLSTITVYFHKFYNI